MLAIIILLRVIRIICALFMSLVFFTLLGPLSNIFIVHKYAPDLFPEILAVIFIKAIALVIALVLFASARILINKLCMNKYGEPHPKLGKSFWAL